LPPKTRINMPENDADTVVAAQRDGTQVLVGSAPAVAPARSTASSRGVLWAVTALMVGACVVISAPLVPALAWALVLAIAGEWLRRLLAPHCRNPSLQAGLSVTILAIVVTAPLLGLAPMVAEEFQRAWADLGSESIRARVDELARQLPALASVIDWLRRHAPSSEDVAAQIVPRVSGLFASSVWGALQWPIAFFAAFFFLRDRHRILRWLAGLLPLQSHETDRLFSRATQVVRANVLGILLLAALQGLLGGLMFWWLGLPAALLWGVVMFVLSLLPVVGAAVVWIPAALWLALEGSMSKALLLTAWGGIVVALVDNLLYPLLVGNKLGLHTLAVFVAIVGGLVVFGASGLVLGPLSLVVTAELIAVCKERRDSARHVGRHGDDES
jgi:predicted PurR-regulated permease PerM